jgi:hypothetical protein
MYPADTGRRLCETRSLLLYSFKISSVLLDNILNGNTHRLVGDVTDCVDVLMTSDKSLFQVRDHPSILPNTEA